MQVKIPREEGEEIAQRVTQAALNLFGWSFDSEDAPHIRPMGSFLRGKRGTSVSSVAYHADLQYTYNLQQPHSRQKLSILAISWRSIDKLWD